MFLRFVYRGPCERRIGILWKKIRFPAGQGREVHLYHRPSPVATRRSLPGGAEAVQDFGEILSDKSCQMRSLPIV